MIGKASKLIEKLYNSELINQASNEWVSPGFLETYSVLSGNNINTIFKVYFPFKWHSREVVSSVSSSHSSHYSGIANPLPSNIGGVGKERVWGHGHTKFVLPHIIFAAVNYC